MGTKAQIDHDIDNMGLRQLRAELLDIRRDIRWHRDQVGDDRCWLDDLKLYTHIPGYLEPYANGMQSRRSFMMLCKRFYENRQNPTETARKRGGVDDADNDVCGMDRMAIATEIARLRAGIRKHRAAGAGRTWRDDNSLYLLLPERLPAATRLPMELLKNCAVFYEAKAKEHPPRIHSW